MKIIKYNNEEEWFDGRRGKITGTKVKGIMPKTRGTGYKMGFYDLIAERIAVPSNLEDAMQRGKRLEELAIEEFEKKTGKKVDHSLVIWQREDMPEIAISPDGFIGEEEAVEVKCLSSGRHIEAWLTKQIPTDYKDQAIQYFVVNDKLQTLYFTFYDPRMPHPIFWIEMHRKDVQDVVTAYLEAERNVLKEIAKIEEELTF